MDAMEEMCWSLCGIISKPFHVSPFRVNLNSSLFILYFPIFWCPLPTFQQRNQIPRRFANCPSRNRPGNDPIVVGDFNLSAFDWQNTRALNNSANNTLLLDIVHDNFLTLLVNSPTREENILDLVLASDPHIVDNLTVGKPFSDHNAITFSISCCPYERHKTGFIYESCFIISLGTMSS